MSELFVMSAEELDRVAVLQRVLERRITRVKAAELLGISERQARRLTKAFELHGPAALADKRRGAPSNRKLSTELRDNPHDAHRPLRPSDDLDSFFTFAAKAGA